MKNIQLKFKNIQLQMKNIQLKMKNIINIIKKYIIIAIVYIILIPIKILAYIYFIFTMFIITVSNKELLKFKLKFTIQRLIRIKNDIVVWIKNKIINLRNNDCSGKKFFRNIKNTIKNLKIPKSDIIPLITLITSIFYYSFILYITIFVFIVIGN